MGLQTVTCASREVTIPIAEEAALTPWAPRAAGAGRAAVLERLPVRHHVERRLRERKVLGCWGLDAQRSPAWGWAVAVRLQR